MKNKIYIKFIVIFIISITLLLFNNSVKAAGVDGTTIVLNPGHGAEWTGCTNDEKNLVEKDITLKIAKYLEEELNKYYGVKVILTHDGVKFPNNDAGDLAARAMIARKNNADLYVSLHIDDHADKSVQGATVYTTSREELPKYKAGMGKLATLILKNLNSLGIKTSSLGIVNDKLCNDHEPQFQYYDGSQADYYGDIRYCMKGDTKELGPNFSDGSGISAVLIEHCYMNNEHDLQFLDSDEDLKKLAKADADAIIAFFELRLKETVVDNIEISKDSLDLIIGEAEKIEITEIGPDTAENKKVTWKSSDEKVAIVDNDGNITAKGEGNAVISVISNDNNNVYKEINVNVEKEEIRIDDTVKSFLIGEEKNIVAKVSPSWTENSKLEWTSSNEAVATISEDGKINPIAVGKTTITLKRKDKDLSDSIEIEVIEFCEASKWEIKEYSVKDKIISKIGDNVKIEDFIKNIDITEDLKVIVVPKTEGQNLIGTGTKVIISEKEHDNIVAEYECVVYGDVNGDGNISPADYVKIKNHIMNASKLEGVYYTAADVNRDGNISPADYVKVKNHIMKVSTIEK